MATPVKLTVEFQAGPVSISVQSSEGDSLWGLTPSEFAGKLLDLAAHVSASSPAMTPMTPRESREWVTKAGEKVVEPQLDFPEEPAGRKVGSQDPHLVRFLEEE